LAAGALSDTKQAGQSNLRLVFLAIATVMLLVNLWLIFAYVPNEISMGVVQRIFYFHVPTVEVGFLAFFVVFVASIVYLFTRKRSADRLALAAAEIGMVFLTVAIIMGAIWAKKAWGVWWIWDAKLTTTFVLWLIYAGYLMVRAYAPTRLQAARWGAIVGIIGFLDVPIVYLATGLLHPAETLTTEGGLEPAMRFAHWFSVTAFIMLFTYLTMLRSGQHHDEERIADLRRTAIS
jgi:heme exporter protein C